MDLAALDLVAFVVASVALFVVPGLAIQRYAAKPFHAAKAVLLSAGIVFVASLALSETIGMDTLRLTLAVTILTLAAGAAYKRLK